MKIRNLLLFLALLGTVSLVAQIQNRPLSQKKSGEKSLLQSGPMPTYSEMREVGLWLQTKTPAEVKVRYYPAESILPDSLAVPVARDTFFTNSIKTQAANAYTAHLVADKVEPGYRYTYEVFIDGKKQNFSYPLSFQTQTLWQYRTDPPPFRTAVGSCAYINETKYDRPGRPYGGEYEIFTALANAEPDAMLWLGDNVYLREADWYSLTGIQKRYTHARSVKEMQPLLAKAHHFAIWDDHDYGPNDSDRSFLHKDKTRRAFTEFWGNPTYGVPGAPEGITSGFQWNDVNFFLLDNRWFRTPNNCKTCEKVYFGKAQIDWLIESLINSKANFNIIATGGQVLSTAKVYENYAKLNPEERAYLLKRINDEGIKNVVFLTGDRHHTELSKMVNPAGNTIYDWTVSPLTSGYGLRKEENLNRVAGTLVTRRNFGTLDFSGSRKNRVLTMTIWSENGEKIWEQRAEAE